jgi:hypothetical protein
VFGLADIHGSDSFVSKRYRAWEAALRGIGPSPWGRPGSPNLRSAAVRYYLTGSEELFPGLQPLAGTVQEDPRALPYARLHPFAQALSEREVRQNLDQPDRDPRVALLSGPGAPSFQGPAQVIPFAARRINGNRLVLEGETPLPGLLVVCEQFDPAWRARVDGRPAAIFPADHLFVGVPIPTGARRVELTYEPASYRAGAFGMLVALGCLCGLLVGGRKRR